MTTNKKPDWEVMLSVINPDKNYPRPRRSSLHTIGYVCGRTDLLALAKEMQESGKVLGYVCPDVKTPIFYLEDMVGRPTMIDTRNSKIWGKWDYTQAGANSLKEFVENNPFPAVKGFKRFGQVGYWSGGSPGKGKFVKGTSAMDVPYEKEDFPYARLIIKALKDAGYTPGLTEEDLVDPTERNKKAQEEEKARKAEEMKKWKDHDLLNPKDFVAKHRNQTVYASVNKYGFEGTAIVRGAGPTSVTLEVVEGEGQKQGTKIFAVPKKIKVTNPDFIPAAVAVPTETMEAVPDPTGSLEIEEEKKGAKALPASLINKPLKKAVKKTVVNLPDFELE